MAKTLFVDGAWTVLGFNSSQQAYYACHDMSLMCCYCHQNINFSLVGKIGASQTVSCPNCGKRITYRPVLLSENLAKAFNVRSRTLSLGSNGVMHVVLPENHNEFRKLLLHIEGERQDLSYYTQYIPKLSVFAQIVNTVNTRFQARMDEINRLGCREKEKAKDIMAIAGAFKQFGRVIYPEIPEFIENEARPIPQEIDHLTKSLEQFLLRKPNMFMDVIQLCSDFLF